MELTSEDINWGDNKSLFPFIICLNAFKYDIIYFDTIDFILTNGQLVSSMILYHLPQWVDNVCCITHMALVQITNK